MQSLKYYHYILMKVYTLDIDSSERDHVLYSNPGDYVISLKTPIYDVKKISLISARIHNSQFLIHNRNNKFDINGTQITIPVGNYGGQDLANAINTASSIITSATYDKDTNAITFTGSGSFTFDFYSGTNGYNTNTSGYTTPHDVLGLPANDISSDSNNKIITGSINLQGIDGIIVKLSSGSDEFNKTVFSDSPFYTGRILMCGDVVNYSGTDDTIEHIFHSGSQNITKLRVQFYYSSNNRLIPYDFRNANHIIKLSVTGTTDRLETDQPNQVSDVMKKQLSSKKSVKGADMSTLDDIVKTSTKKEDFDKDEKSSHKWDALIQIFIILIFGVLLLLLLTSKKKIIE